MGWGQGNAAGAKARQDIDCQLDATGWTLQDFVEINPSAGQGVAVREFPLLTGPADYLLYLDGKVAGVIEAKPMGHPLIGVEVQSLKYMNGLPDKSPPTASRLLSPMNRRAQKHASPTAVSRTSVAVRCSPSIAPRSSLG